MADKPLRGQLWQMLGRALEYAVVWGYFYAWSYKTEVRKALKVSALGAIAVPTALLAAEVAAETLGAHEIAAALIALSSSTTGKALFYAFIASVLFLLWHHVEEARKPGYEYVFVQRLCDFLEGRGDVHNPGPTVAQSLELFHSVFSKAGIAHASLHLWTGKDLSIDKAHVFPAEADPSFFVTLGPGEGVAGRV